MSSWCTALPTLLGASEKSASASRVARTSSSETSAVGCRATGALPRLPLPGIAAVAIFTAIQVWNEFLFGLVFTSGGTSAPITVGIAALIQPQEIRFGAMAAVGTVTAVPIILLAIAANRQIVAGLTRGAVKG